MSLAVALCSSNLDLKKKKMRTLSACMSKFHSMDLTKTFTVSTCFSRCSKLACPKSWPVSTRLDLPRDPFKSSSVTSFDSRNSWLTRHHSGGPHEPHQNGGPPRPAVKTPLPRQLQTSLSGGENATPHGPWPGGSEEPSKRGHRCDLRPLASRHHIASARWCRSRPQIRPQNSHDQRGRYERGSWPYY